MSASTHLPAIEQVSRVAPDGSWPACEQAVLPGDGSMQWLGLLLLGGTSLITLKGLLWVGQTALAHL